MLVGSRSFGKGSVQSVIPIAGYGALRLTTARYYTPSGRSIQGLGITPDVPVAQNHEDIRKFGSERGADLNHPLKDQRGTRGKVGRPCNRPANHRQVDTEQTAGAFPTVRSGQTR